MSAELEEQREAPPAGEDLHLPGPSLLPFFCALGITKGVFGNVTENIDGTYTLAVHSADGSVNCWLTNSLPVRHGPANRVDVSCSDPSGTATSPNAVVNVTGP